MSAVLAGAGALYYALPVSGPSESASKQAVQQERSEPFPESIQKRLTEGTRVERKLLLLYQTRNFEPLWIDDNEPNDNAAAMIDALKKAGEHGLPATYVQEINEKPDLVAGSGAGHGDRRAAVDFELQLSAAALRYAHDMRLGRVKPENVYDDASFPARDDDLKSELARVGQDQSVEDFLKTLAPQNPQYVALKDGLARYRAIAAAGGWPTVVPVKSGAARDILKRRLIAEKYLAPDANTVEEALKQFQARNGLEADGKLGSKTIDMLNVPADERAEQIAANMERLRWLPREPGNRYILVNVADASLSFIKDSSVQLTSKVVVGAPKTATPLLQTVATAITVNPAWHVPESIVQKEILPKLAEDPGYLDRKNMTFEDGKVKQDPGDDNALGVLKFEMANKFNVYLHDTPAKSAFNAVERDLSHGCVRVEAILPLSALALEKDETDIQDAIAQGETRQLALKHPIPVYITYSTAFANEDGSLSFRRDIYHRDARLIAALEATAS
jgi:murein L,D-transpeptidase YcbB/YkuD